MKKTLLMLSIAFVTKSYGQWTDGDIAPDFTINDQYGVSHNLYSELNAGKPVLLDFSFPACKYCWNDCVFGTMSNNNSAYGIEGSNQIRTYFIDIWGGANSIPNLNGFDITNQNISRGDFAYYANYPLLNQGAAYGNTMMVQSAPTYMLVCPDKKAYAIGETESWLVSTAQSKCSCTLAKTTNKVRIYVPELSTCAGLNRVNVYGHLINTGSNNITSAQIKLMIGNVVLKSQTLTYSGTNTTPTTMDLTEFKFDSVLINQPIGSYSKGPYKIVVDMINGTNLTTPFEKIIKITKTPVITNNLNLGVELKTDGFSSQTSWVIYNSKGNIVAQNPILSNNVTSNTSITLSNNECYTLRLKDSGGDGLDNDGYLKIKTPSNTDLCNLKYGTNSYENFGYDVFSSFQVGNLTSITNFDQIHLPKLSIYPNPIIDKFRVETSDKITLHIIDIYGKVIKEFKDVDNSVFLDVSDLATGNYLAQFNDGKAFQSITIIKK